MTVASSSKIARLRDGRLVNDVAEAWDRTLHGTAAAVDIGVVREPQVGVSVDR